MEQPKNKYILVSGREVRISGSSMKSTPTQVLRGELLEALPKDEQPSDSSRIALVGVDRKSLNLECCTEDLIRLSDEDVNLLLAISSLEERYRTSTDKKSLDFGRRLSQGDPVFVSVKGISEGLPGVVRYKGELPLNLGTMFGVELVRNPGQGTTDGTFRNKRYFTCAPDSGVFVGLGKLKPNSTEATGKETFHKQEQIGEDESFARSMSYYDNRPSGQLREKELQEASLHEQLREKIRQEENLQRCIKEMEEQLRTLRGQLSKKEEETCNLQKQFTDLNKDFRDTVQELVKVNKTLFETETKLKEYQRQETHDWIIPRDEIVMTETCLGSGSWGDVMEGKYCGSTVAVKKLREAVISNNKKKFEREMDIASKCRHPCLLQFIGATNDESPLFVTELMESSLLELLKKGPLDPKEVFTISLDVARALSYLHQKKPTPILHRDVSSPNVLLWRCDNQWRGKVSDYGTANFLQETMTAGPGAMIYSAPEASTPYQQTEKIDVYSFGVLLCEMCSDKERPDPERRNEQVENVSNERLQAVIRRCLQSDPEKRPNMAEIIAELEQLSKMSY